MNYISSNSVPKGRDFREAEAKMNIAQRQMWTVPRALVTSSHPDGQSALKAHCDPREVRQGSNSSLAIPKDWATVTVPFFKPPSSPVDPIRLSNNTSLSPLLLKSRPLRSTVIST